MIKQKGIARKTFIFTALLITVIICVSFGILYFILPDYYLYSKHKTLQNNADMLTHEMNNVKTQEECALFISEFAIKNNADVIAFDKQGALLPMLSSPFVLMNEVNEFGYSPFIRESQPLELQRNSDMIIVQKEGEATPLESGKTSYFFTWSNEAGELTIARKSVAAAAIIQEINNDIIGRLAITSTLQPIDEAKDVMLSLLPFLLVLDIGIALVCAYMYTKKLTKPIVQIAEAAEQMRMMAPFAQSNIRTNDELGRLSQTLDSMYASLKESIEDLQQEIAKVNELEQAKTYFMRAAGHELKTPIAALSGILEGMIDNIGVYKNKEEYLQKCKALVNNMATLVNQILSASRSKTPIADKADEEIDLTEMIDQILMTNEPMIDEKGLCVEKDIRSIILHTDKNMLRQTLDNLLSNAVMYTRHNGRIRISIEQEDGKTCLSIENQCAPIPDSELPKLFEPFYTLDYSRDKSVSGTGLGLYIVKRNLDALGIAYEIQNASLGLLISLWFAQ